LTTDPARPTPLVLSLARLVRLPNVFTAPPDILIGSLLTGPALIEASQMVPTILASAFLYMAGMIFNDWFDVDQDRLERPHRPLPAGEISLPVAFALGSVALVIGVGLAWSVHSVTGVVATLLAGSILLYDGLLKRFSIAPCVMGTCRALNVLLGAAATRPESLYPISFDHMSEPLAWGAGVVGIYITGVTLFARHEAGTPSAIHLVGGASLIALALGIWMFLWESLARGSWIPLVIGGLLVLRLAYHLGKGIQSRQPRDIQRAVTMGIVSLLLAHAITAIAADSPNHAILILLHLIPIRLLGRWIYST
jgi:4-hydroxybenzoate polyprenyltransferase